MSLLAELHRQGSTIVMVTHADEIAAYAQRIIRFRDGRIESDRTKRPAGRTRSPVRRPTMRSDKVIQIAWSGLAKNKLRSLLTMLGVIIGVAAVIIMIAISAGTEKDHRGADHRPGHQPDLRQPELQPGRSAGQARAPGGGLVYDDALAIADNVQGVTGVVVEQNSSQTVKVGNVTLDDVSILGTTADFPRCAI